MNLIIPLLILTPLVGSVVVLCFRKSEGIAKTIGLITAVVSFLLSASLAFQVDRSSPNESQVTGAIQPRIIFEAADFRVSLPAQVGGEAFNWSFQLGADGISAALVFLTGVVGLGTVLLAFRQIRTSTSVYIGLILMAIGMLMGVFLAMDLLTFYIFFECVLIPLVFLIYGWGNGPNPQGAATRFLLFTLLGSIPMVLGLIWLAIAPTNDGQPVTVSLNELSAFASAKATDGIAPGMWDYCALWLLLFGLGIKLAILPLYSWLPQTYIAAHPNTTSLLASVVAKLGFYGLLRIVVPLTPETLASEAQILFGTLGAVAIVYGALIALTREDLREVLAFSSLSHVGFITLGLMSMTKEGLGGATLQMLNHGLVTAAMFWTLSMLEERQGRINIKQGELGLASYYPKLAVFLVFFVLAGAGLPGLNCFVGELLTMSGMLRVSSIVVSIAVMGTILGAWYGLRIIQQVLFGEAKLPKHSQQESRSADLSISEWSPLAAVAILCLWIGCLPMGMIGLFSQDTERLATVVEPIAKHAHPEMDTLTSN